MSNKSDTQFCLPDPPTDGITALQFHSTKSNQLLSASWDKTIRLYDTISRKLNLKLEYDSPILDTCFAGDNKALSVSMDGKVNYINLDTQQQQLLGTHEEGIRAVCYSQSTNTVYSGSWDKTLRVWDPQSSTSIGKYDLRHKVFSMDLKENKLAIAMSYRKVFIYDTRNMSKPWQTRELKLRNMLKCIRISPDGKGFVCSSIEGKAVLEYFDDEEQVKTTSFKLHRQIVDGYEVVYPVNSLSFHPIHGTFASGGSDGVVSIWDPVNKKRLRQYSKFPEEISTLAFNSNGTQLAIGSSYTFDEGERPHYPDAIFIRNVDEYDCKPR